MAEELPQFSLVTKRERGEEKNLLKFVWLPRPSLTCGVAFRPIDDGFDAWVGWSTSGRFPYMAAQADPTPAPDSPFDFARTAIMVPSINLSGRSGLAAWMLWEPAAEEIDDPAAFAKAYVEHATKEFSPKEAMDLVMPRVKSAVKEVRDYGLPYLQRRNDADLPT
jgi:hypothetical protein